MDRRSTTTIATDTVANEQEDHGSRSPERRPYPVTGTLANGAVVLVPRHVEGQQNDVTNVTIRPLPGDCNEERAAFLQDFEDNVIDLIRDIRRQFPYEQTIRWSMEYGNDILHMLKQN
jgi:hypothetical protein